MQIRAPARGRARPRAPAQIEIEGWRRQNPHHLCRPPKPPDEPSANQDQPESPPSLPSAAAAADEADRAALRARLAELLRRGDAAASGCGAAAARRAYFKVALEARLLVLEGVTVGGTVCCYRLSWRRISALGVCFDVGAVDCERACEPASLRACVRACLRANHIPPQSLRERAAALDARARRAAERDLEAVKDAVAVAQVRGPVLRARPTDQLTVTRRPCFRRIGSSAYVLLSSATYIPRCI